MNKETERRIRYLEGKIDELERRLNAMTEAWKKQLEVDRELSKRYYRRTGQVRPDRWD